jgi:Ethanolamine utilization protein EutJ (predicted chaperonin)
MGIDFAAILGRGIDSELFLLDDIFEDELRELDDECPQPGIFLKQRLCLGADLGIPTVVLVVVDG